MHSGFRINHRTSDNHTRDDVRMDAWIYGERWDVAVVRQEVIPTQVDAVLDVQLPMQARDDIF